jgi:hypothetical protein
MDLLDKLCHLSDACRGKSYSAAISPVALPVKALTVDTGRPGAPIAAPCSTIGRRFEIAIGTSPGSGEAEDLRLENTVVALFVIGRGHHRTVGSPRR